MHSNEPIFGGLWPKSSLNGQKCVVKARAVTDSDVTPWTALT